MVKPKTEPTWLTHCVTKVMNAIEWQTPPGFTPETSGQVFKQTAVNACYEAHEKTPFSSYNQKYRSELANNAGKRFDKNLPKAIKQVNANQKFFEEEDKKVQTIVSAIAGVLVYFSGISIAYRAIKEVQRLAKEEAE